MRGIQSSNILEQKEAEKIAFDRFPNSSYFAVWKMNFKSEVCSSSSYPTDTLARIHEIDSVKSMEELKVSTFFLVTDASSFRSIWSKKLQVLVRSC